MALTANQLAVALFNAAVGGYKSYVDGKLAKGDAAAAGDLLIDSGLASITDNGTFAYALVEKATGGSLTPAQVQQGADVLVGYMNAGMTRAGTVIEVINYLSSEGALSDATFGSAAQLFQNKVVAADAYTGASTDLSALQAILADATDFNLTADLAADASAHKAVADFLKGLDLDNNPATKTTEADVNNELALAAEDADLVQAGYSVDNTDAVNDANIAARKAVLAANVVSKEAAMTTANTNVAKVAGLASAIASLEAAIDASDAADIAAAKAVGVSAGEESAYELANSTSITINDNGTVTNLIVLDTDGKTLKLATDVTETTNPGVTDLLTAIVARETTEAAATKAAAAQTAAQLTVNDLDVNPATSTADNLLEAVSAAMVAVVGTAKVTPADTTAPIYATRAEFTAAQENAVAAIKAAFANVVWTTDAAGTEAAFGNITDALVAAKLLNATGQTSVATAFNAALTLQADLPAAIAAAQADLVASTDTFVGAAIAAYETAAAGDNTLYAAWSTADTNLTAAQKTVTDLDKALVALDEALVNSDQLTALNKAITAAEKAITVEGYNLVHIDGTDAATTADDIFVAGTVNTEILNFGLQGTDKIYIGSTYTLNTGKIATAGNDAVLEVFIADNANGDAVISLETKAFSSNSSDAETTITLVGVSAADLALANGVIQLA